MRQLTGVDTSFLNFENPRSVGHVTNVYVIDPSTTDLPMDIDSIRKYVGERLHLIEALNWRLIEVPYGIDRPYWAEDPDIDLSFHVRALALPKPGSDLQLSEQVARMATRVLDRTRPLWELYVIEGLQGGRIALVLKLHHAAFDGKATVKLLTTLFSAEPTAPVPPPPPAKEVEVIPTPLEMWQRGWLNAITQPEQSLRYMQDMAREASELAKRMGYDPADWWRLVQGPAGQAPRVAFNATLSQHRNWAFGSLSLDEVKETKNAAGVTLNDVVMALCTGALRRWLIDHNDLPDAPLRAMVPVSTRTADEAAGGGNQVSSMVAELPTNLDDPLARLKAAHVAMLAAKEQHAAIPAGMLTSFSEYTAPAAAQLVSKTLSDLRWADQFAPPFNVVVSNVPGPREPLYFSGALLEAAYPMSLISDGVGLNFTFASIRDRLFFGNVATPEYVPDIWNLTKYLAEELGVLRAALGLAVH